MSIPEYMEEARRRSAHPFWKERLSSAASYLTGSAVSFGLFVGAAGLFGAPLWAALCMGLLGTAFYDTNARIRRR